MLRCSFPRLLLPALVLAVVAASCSGSADPTATPTATAVPTPVPTATPPPAATPETGPSTLLEVMRRFPDSTREEGFWFGDVARTLGLARIEKVDNLQDFLALGGVGVMAYQNALREIPQPSVVLTAGPGNVAFGQTFGFDAFTADVAAGIGEISSARNQIIYMEGPFDGNALRLTLRSLGYRDEVRSGIPYFALGDDFSVQQSGDGPVGDVAFNRMNRVAVFSDAVAAAPSTRLLGDLLDAEAGDVPSLADDPAFAAVADALGDPLSAVLLLKEDSLLLQGRPPPHLFDFGIPDHWGGLHEWDVMGFGLREEGGQRSWRLALHYLAPGVAYLDGDELVRRMLGYASLVPDVETTGRRLYEESCAGLDWSHRGVGEGSVLVLECRLVESPPVAWPFFVNARDMAFLLS